MFKVHTPFSFWKQAVQLEGSVARLVLPRVALFGLWAVVMSLIHYDDLLPDLHIEVAPYEAAGAALGLLMVMRTNAGYERWWEGRKLWGSITNTTRTLAITATAYGPDDPEWQARIVRRIATFAHVCRRSLRNERDLPEVAALLGEDEAREIAECDHMPSAVARLIARDLRSGLDNFAFLQADAQRALLLDFIGGAERILKTPMPLAYAIEVRRFIFLFLLTMPFVLFNQIEHARALWLAPLITVLVAYPLVAIDKIGHELQHPFATYRLNHLPLDTFTDTIERNVLALLDSRPREESSSRPTESHPSPTRDDEAA